MREPILIFDRVLPDPLGYRAEALAQPFTDVTFGAETFRGIAPVTEGTLPIRALDLLWEHRGLRGDVNLTFFRRSPHGQPEPNYIHSDAEMGDWTGIFYLNPSPAPGDGTVFWERLSTGHRAGPWDEALTRLAKAEPRAEYWRPWHTVPAAFNRLVVFQSDLFHSRAIEENYGVGDDARLTQVVFGTWRTERLVL